jgi:hypothetical protein
MSVCGSSCRLHLLSIPLLFALVSCGIQSGADSNSVNVMPEPRDGLSPTGETVSPELQTLVDIARSDLARRLEQQQLSTDDILVLRAERVTWRSGALGCPLPDRGYMMVLTPGVRILLSANGVNYAYHSSLHGRPFLCEPPGRVETPAPSGHSLDPT